MQLQFIPYILPGAALAVLPVSLAFAAWRRRFIPRERVIESMKEALIVLDTQDRIVDLNPAARRLITDKTSKVIGRPFARVFPSWPKLVEYCQSLEETDEEVIASQSDEPHYFGLRITPLSHHAEHITFTGRLIALYDITARVQAEKALKESERRFRTIFAEVPVGMAIIDLEGSVLQVNKAFCEMLGYGEQELRGFKLSAITHPDDIGADTLLAGKALSGEMSSYKVEKRYLKKNGETLWADLTATILRNQRGEAIYGLVMLENIIERKRAKLLEEERYHVAYELHDGLAQVAVSVHQHLQAFAGHYRPRAPQARQELDRALELAQRSVREARRLIAGLRPTVLDDFGLAMALRLQIEAQRKDGWTVTYEETLGSERLPAMIETTLYRVAQEALTNMRKHAHTEEARITLHRKVARLRMEIQDWGCGFDVEAALSGEHLPGEHVGLREMRERVELIGGQLEIRSQPCAGTLIAADVPLPPSNRKDSVA